MNSRRSLLLLAALVGILTPVAIVAHVRLISATNGIQLRWNSPTNIGIVVNSTGSDNITDGSDEIAIRLAIDEWNAINGTTAMLVEDTNSSQQARVDWAATNIHLVLFDEVNSSGFFPMGSGTVAITPLLYNSISGKILDSDILFNGGNFLFTTTQQASRFDIQDIATHELGHLLGLDHTAVSGGTMYPYVDPSVILHRSLSADDQHGMRDAYPSAAQGAITGIVRRQSDSSNVSGAFVVALDADGRNITASLTSASGAFVLKGLDPGTYTVYARPMDSPVSSANLGPGFSIQTDFQPATYGSTATIATTETANLGVLNVGANSALVLGTNADVFPIYVEAGTPRTISIRGSGLVSGSTLSISDTDIVLGTPTWSTSMVSVQVTVPGGEVPGHVDLTVTNPGGDVSVLSGGIEIVPAVPAVTGINPSSGSTAGGTPVTITGTNFRAGLRIVIGDQIYSDADSTTNVISSTSIQLVTTATLAGTFDVVVLDASGLEGRLSNGFLSAAIPSITTVFPPTGTAGGGTTVTLVGQNFQAGVVVRIDGVTQANVVLSGTTELSFTTVAATAGGPFLLEVENTDSGLANSLFSFASLVDPVATSLTPATGVLAGGDTVMLTGAGFTATTTVTFGVDAATGAGGVPAASVNFLSSNSLEVVTPAFSAAGLVAILVRQPSTGQAMTLANGFNVAAPPSSSSGGGGCYMVPFDGPSGGGPREFFLGAWWILALGLWFALRARAGTPSRA